MKSKTLETLLAKETGLYSDMVTRFQKLRDFGYLPKARGRNAEFLETRHIVLGILSIVACKPGLTGPTVSGLRDLQPVGLPEDAFAGAPTLSAAIEAALKSDGLLSTIKEIRLGDSDPIQQMATSAEIVYTGGVTQYVPGTALSLFQKGMEKNFDRRTLGQLSVMQETVIAPRLLVRIVREMKQDSRTQETPNKSGIKVTVHS